MPPSPNLHGALYMIVAMVGFAFNDAITKHSSTSMNMAQVMLVRGIFASALITVLACQRGALASPRLALHPLVALRALAEAGGTVSFLLALAHLPLANVSAVMQALPLAVTMGAALVFGEGVGWRRWLAIATGFVGVMIVVRPGFEGFSSYSLLALASVVCCMVRDLVTKKIPTQIPTLLVSTTTAMIITVLGGFLLAPMGGWTPMSTLDLTLLAVAAVLVLIGYQFVILSMRTGDVSFVAPYRYTALLWSMLLGFVVFDDIPDTVMLLGSAIIVASGLYTFYRERVVGRPRNAVESTGPTMEPDGI
ncbi:EamA family transporter [Mesorhizobium loti]|nr:DMT family transporter [Mesorhizobium loti]PLP57506.1 EamA family transporter [Mesorhizobium loti]